MKLIETTILSAIATSIKMFAALVINKTVALYAGPSGIALIGQMQNIIQIANVFSQGGVNAGVIKYTAEYKNDPKKILTIWSNSIRITIICSFFVGIILITLSNKFSQLFLNSSLYSYIFIILGFTIFLFAINQLLISILNGLKEIKKLTAINITQSIITLFVTSILVIKYGIHGALIGLVTNQSLVFLAALFMLRKHSLIKPINFSQKYRKSYGYKLFKYSAMALTTAILTPSVYLFIRNEIGTMISWEYAGYWQSIVYISSMYLMVISIALSTYYLPRLSEIINNYELRKELLNGYIVIIPIVILMSFTIYFLRDFIVSLLFTDDFYEVIHLFKWQLIGDVFKVCGFLMSYIMLAKAMTREYIITEIFFSFSLALLAKYFLVENGILGITFAYSINSLCYFLAMIFITKKYWTLT